MCIASECVSGSTALTGLAWWWRVCQRARQQRDAGQTFGWRAFVTLVNEVNSALTSQLSHSHLVRLVRQILFRYFTHINSINDRHLFHHDLHYTHDLLSEYRRKTANWWKITHTGMCLI